MKKETKINCPHCKATNVRMIDYQGISVGEDIAYMGLQFDTELYGKFDCLECEKSFDTMLTISFNPKK